MNHMCVIETDVEEIGDDVVAMDPPAQSGERSESRQAAGVKPVGVGWGGGRGTQKKDLLNIFSLPVGGWAGPASPIHNYRDTVTPRQKVFQDSGTEKSRKSSSQTAMRLRSLCETTRVWSVKAPGLAHGASLMMMRELPCWIAEARFQIRGNAHSAPSSTAARETNCSLKRLSRPI